MFKLDTGAKITAISEKSLAKMGKVILQTPSKALHGPTSQSLKVMGQFNGTLKHQELTSKQSIFIVKGLKSNLLGLPAITALQLLHRIDAAHMGELDIRRRYSELFKGLGNIGEAYTIKQKENAVPHCLFTPRNVPIPLWNKVQEELRWMKAAGSNLQGR